MVKMVERKLLVILSIVNLAIAIHTGYASRYLPVEELTISSIKSDNNSFERKLQISLEQSEISFKRIKAVFEKILFTKGPRIVPEVEPAVSTAIQVIKLVISEPNEEDWVEPLLDSIKQYVDPQIPYDIVKAQLRDVQAQMKSLNTILNIVMSNVTKLDTKLNNLVIAENILGILATNFSDPSSPLQQFPLVAVRPLFGIAAFLPPFEALRYEWKQNLVKVSYVSCTFSKILSRYRTLTATDRVRWVESYPKIDEFWKKVSNLAYNYTGYIDTETLTCSRPIDAELRRAKLPHIWDHFDSKFYEAPIVGLRRKNGDVIVRMGTITLQCMEGFLKVLRQRIEGVFVKPLAMVNKVCATAKEARRIYLSN